MKESRIAYLSILVGIFGICITITGFYVDLTNTNIAVFFWKIFDFFSPNIRIAAFSKDLSALWFFTENYNVFDILGFCVQPLLIIGGIQFIKTKYINRNILLFSYAVIFFTKILVLMQSLLGLSEFLATHKSLSISETIQLFHIIMWIIIAYYALKCLVVRKTKENIAQEKASKFHRLFHFFVDLALCTLLCLSHFELELNNNTNSLMRFCGIFTMVNLLYYGLFEAIFSSTPGKFSTGSKVVLKTNEKLDFISVFIRTITRFLPFEVLSILFSSDPWHDRISNTKVIKY